MVKLQTRFVTSKNDKTDKSNASNSALRKQIKGVGKGRIRRQEFTKLGAQGPFESLMCSDVLFGVLLKR